MLAFEIGLLKWLEALRMLIRKNIQRCIQIIYQRAYHWSPAEHLLWSSTKYDRERFVLLSSTLPQLITSAHPTAGTALTLALSRAKRDLDIGTGIEACCTGASFGDAEPDDGTVVSWVMLLWLQSALVQRWVL